MKDNYNNGVINNNGEDVEINSLFNDATLEEADGSQSSSEESGQSSTSTSNGELTEEEKILILKQLGIMDLSIFAICLIIFASVVNIQYLEWQKAKLLDTLNSTNFSESMNDLTEVPKQTNLIYLFVVSIFVGIIWDNHRTAVNQTGEERDEQAINDTYTNLIAILLILLATTMNFDVLNK